MSQDPRHIKEFVEAAASDEAPSPQPTERRDDDNPAASFDQWGGGDPIQ